jgi:hypothetical protein
MPEFQMPLGNQQTWQCLDSFTQGYWEALFFTNSGESDDELNGLSFADVSKEAWDRALSDCLAFQATHAVLLSEAYERDYTPEQAGRDYWFTRNGHGVGFWDRSELAADDLGDRLSAVTRGSSIDPYKGDDGRIYF